MAASEVTGPEVAGSEVAGSEVAGSEVVESQVVGGLKWRVLDLQVRKWRSLKE